MSIPAYSDPKQAIKMEHDEFTDLIDTLADQIADYIIECDFTPVLLPIPRGGLVPATYLSHKLGLKLISYLTIAKMVALPENDIRPSSIIIVEDCIDTGSTMRSYNWLVEEGAKVAAVVTKIWTPENYMPDFYSLVVDSWIRFPWEIP